MPTLPKLKPTFALRLVSKVNWSSSKSAITSITLKDLVTIVLCNKFAAPRNPLRAHKDMQSKWEGDDTSPWDEESCPDKIGVTELHILSKSVSMFLDITEAKWTKMSIFIG
jgi:hypothetical protein